VQPIFVSSEFHEPYFKHLEPILPWNVKARYSYVTHHMLFLPKLLQNFMHQVTSIGLDTFFVKIMEASELNQHSPFSIDYELYGQCITKGGAVGLVDRLTCPIVWLPTYSEEQAFYERL
jgi:hypothetical protein